MYVIIEPIQSGTFSTVYRAWDRQGQRYVAMKVMPRRNYGDEIETMRVLGSSHPHICSMLNFHEDEGSCILVLEHCQFGDLRDFFELSRRRGFQSFPLDLGQVTRQIYSAITYAHSLGVAHLDIKPENILVTADGNVKLADWGHAVCERWSNETNVGTDAYRSPETFSGKIYDNFKVDYWSFGLTLLYAAFGRTPFKCSKDSDGSTIPYTVCCENFAQLVRDPNQLMYQFYIEPLLEGDPSASAFDGFSSQSSASTDNRFLPIFDLIQFCRTIVENLVNIDAGKRNIHEFIRNLNKHPENNQCELSLDPSIRLPPFLRIKN